MEERQLMAIFLSNMKEYRLWFFSNTIGILLPLMGLVIIFLFQFQWIKGLIPSKMTILVLALSTVFLTGISYIKTRALDPTWDISVGIFIWGLWVIALSFSLIAVGTSKVIDDNITIFFVWIIYFISIFISSVLWAHVTALTEGGSEVKKPSVDGKSKGAIKGLVAKTGGGGGSND